MIGAMRHQVAIETPTRSRTASGGYTVGWAAITGGDAVWARLRPLRPYEIQRYGHTVGRVSHKLTLRAGLTVTTKMRVTYNGRHFAIVGVLGDVDERNRFAELVLEETISGGPTTGDGS